MKAKTRISALLLAVLIILAAACGSANEPSDSSFRATHSGVQNIGSGSKTFLFEATDGAGNKVSWNVSTNAATVGEALVEVGLIEGDYSDFGLMVSHVHGLRADFTEDNAWWAFYIDDEMAMAGVDSIEIEEGVTYAFIHTPA